MYQKLEVQLGDVQLDCQLEESAHPVVIHQRRNTTSSPTTPFEPFIKTTMIKVQPATPTPTSRQRLAHFEYVGFGAKAFVVHVDQVCTHNTHNKH